MKKIDMHIHTNASDGVYTAAEAVKIAKEKGIEIFAISDHDSIVNVAESVALANQAGIICVPAMEATTSFNGLEIHVLGYGLDLTHPLLQKYLDETYQIRRNKEINIIKKAKELFGGDDINLEDFEKFAETKQRGGFLSYNYLRKKGKIKDLDGFFNLKNELDLQQCPFQSTKDVMKCFTPSVP
jgi:predicted metal-dependent phosphoesterase TrpH